MATRNYQESSSSSFSRCKYQVFLSFRGKDTRKNFTDHLRRALVQARIHTFRDDDEIERGENIDLELQRAIEQSEIFLIVFSKDYASSRWCLNELVMIMERKRTTGCMVLPVFYDVHPSQVRNQTGSFVAAFMEHEKCFKEEMVQVNGWRIALKEVADLGGMVLGDGYEAKLVQSIVEKVSNKLDRKKFHSPRHFLGRDPLINYINSWLQDGSNGASIAILHGIGGVGKTTIAKIVYNQNFDKFEGRSFVSSVRERSNESSGVVFLQRQLLSDILNKTVDEIHDVDEGLIKIKDALCCRRTLIVLDDVDKTDQFTAIVGMKNWLFKGSKIIVTTRNKGLIADDDECVKCKVKPLDDEISSELFSWHAFRQAHPVEDFVEDSWRVVQHCNGLPLALCVIGSSLSGKQRKVWESILQEIEVIPNCDVQKVLRISYDSLDDDYQKNLFLDIACFFNDMDEDHVVRILDGLGIGAMHRVDNLIDRCLLEKYGKRLCMHQLIRDMGREIARQESFKCQRIWHHSEAFTLLKETIDAEKLRGLTLDMNALMEDNCTKFAYIDSIVGRKRRLSTFLSGFFFGEQVQIDQTSLWTDSFRKMKNVKFLQLNYLKFYGSYEHFPKNLIWLCWHGFSLRSIPEFFCFEKLVVLDLSRSSLVDARKGKLCLPKLKILDLRHSHDLIRTPDFSGLPSLEEIILEDCICLVWIHESIGDLRCLLVLNLRNCTSLMKLPEEVSRLNSLEMLVLDGCSNMELEDQEGCMLLQNDGIVASTTSYITSLPLKLFFPFRFSARKISRFTSSSLPPSLRTLNLRGTPIHFLPKSIKNLSTLKYLLLENCKMLQTLPELPSNLLLLNVSYCYSLQRLTNPSPVIIAPCCDQLGEMDWIKQGLIQKADSHMFRLIEMVINQMQPRGFQIELHEGNKFSVVLRNEGNEMLRWNQTLMFSEEKEEDMWIIPNEFVDNLSFKVSSPAANRICGFNLFNWFYSIYDSSFHIEIRNNTKDKVWVFYPIYQVSWSEKTGVLWAGHWKCEGHDAVFDNGDDVSVSVSIDKPVVQIIRFAIRILYEEEGNDDKMESNNDSSEVMTAHSSCYDGHVAKEKIVSHILRNYCLRYRRDFPSNYTYTFVKKKKSERRE